MNVHVKWKKLRNTAYCPTYATDQSVGLDLYSPEDFHLYSWQNRAILLGLALEIPDDFFGLIRPRSGLAFNQKIRQMGSGVVDPDYRGEVKVHLWNFGTMRYDIKRGDRIAQLLILPFYRAKLEETDELSTTVRENGGFGSTGK